MGWGKEGLASNTLGAYRTLSFAEQFMRWALELARPGYESLTPPLHLVVNYLTPPDLSYVLWRMRHHRFLESKCTKVN